MTSFVDGSYWNLIFIGLGNNIPNYAIMNLFNLLECLLVGGVDLPGDAVVVVGELPDELLLGVCRCQDGGHGQNEGEGCAVHYVLVVVVGAAKWKGKYVIKVLKWLAQG